MNDGALLFGTDSRDKFDMRHLVSRDLLENQYFNRDGNCIERKHFVCDESFEADVDFVVLPTGDVMSVAHGEWSLFTYTNDKNQEEQFVGIARKLYFDDGIPMLELRHVKTDEELAFMPNARGDVRDLIIEDDTVLEARSFQGSLRLYNMDHVHLPNCESTFYEMRRWLRGRMHPEIGFWSRCEGIKNTILDVYDLLELYFVPLELLWRTRVGEHLFRHFLQPLGTKNKSLAQKLLEAKAMDIVEDATVLSACVWCGFEAANMRVVLEPQLELFVNDSSCVFEVRLFHAIGKWLREFRASPDFNSWLVRETQQQFAALYLMFKNK